MYCENGRKTALAAKIRCSCHSVCTREASAKQAAIPTRPMTYAVREPYLSTKRPVNGPTKPAIRKELAKAAEIAVRDQRKFCSSGSTKVPIARNAAPERTVAFRT